MAESTPTDFCTEKVGVGIGVGVAVGVMDFLIMVLPPGGREPEHPDGSDTGTRHQQLSGSGLAPAQYR